MSEEEFRACMEKYDEEVVAYKSVDDRICAITIIRGTIVAHHYLIYDDGTVYRSMMLPGHTREVTHWFSEDLKTSEEFKACMAKYDEEVVAFNTQDEFKCAIAIQRGTCVVNHYLIYEDGTVYRSLMQPAHTVEVTHWFDREVIS